MSERNALPTAADLANSTLAGREVAVKWLNEARSVGDKKEIRALESKLRRIDALIAKYGMERYALPP